MAMMAPVCAVAVEDAQSQGVAVEDAQNQYKSVEDAQNQYKSVEDAPARKQETKDMTALTVLAPASLTEAMTELSRLYSRMSGTTVSVAFGTSDGLRRRIVEGQPSDMILTEDERALRDLRNRGLLDVNTQVALYPLRLVVLASKPFPAERVPDVAALPEEQAAALPAEQQLLPWHAGEAAEAGDAAARRAEVIRRHAGLRGWLLRRPLVLADPEATAAGAEARALMQALFLPLPEPGPDVVEDSRAVVRELLRRPAVGVAFMEDVYNIVPPERASEIEVVAVPAPEEKGYRQPVLNLAVVAGEHMEEARKLAGFLRSEEAKKIFRKYHFLVDK